MMASRPIVVLDTNPLWIRLPFEQLGRHIPVIGLKPQMTSKFLHCPRVKLDGPGFTEVPLLLPRRAFGRLSVPLAPLIAFQIQRVTGPPRAVIYTFPVYRELPRWFRQTPAFYYASDDYSIDYGVDSNTLLDWEFRLVHQVRRVFAVSEALADILAQRHGLCRSLITVIPNGVPSCSIPSTLPLSPSPAPAPIPAHFRPLAGVIGTLSKRLRVEWVAQAVEALPWLHWAFVGPIEELDADSAVAVAKLQANPRCCFTGAQNYGRLFEFAASFDVGVIPLTAGGINPTCSPVRLFTQLPFGQPILATPGCRQLDGFAPLVETVTSAQDLILHLTRLRDSGFTDGLADARWMASHDQTWEKRGQSLHHHICASLCS